MEFDYKTPDSDATFVIFGATGDLTKRKLMPALFSMQQNNTLGKKSQIVCVSIEDYSKEDYVKGIELKKFLNKPKKKELQEFINRIHYIKADFIKSKFKKIKSQITAIEKKYNSSGRIFYLAIPAFLFSPVTRKIKSSGLLKGKGFRRAIVEKPFGHDTKSAEKLNKIVTRIFKEDSVFRIDHYLAKEVVQSILVLRFANSLFEHVWNSEHIDHIQITVAEELGVEKRARYYDQAGAIKDMVQNHLMQIIAFLAMEGPFTIGSTDISNEKVRLLKAIKNPKPKDIVIGQYSSGTINGKKAIGYRKESEIKKNSITETFAALRLEINNKRWKGVPFYIRTGKRLERKQSEVVIVFKDVVCNLFCKEGVIHAPNTIRLKIFPKEGFTLGLNVKGEERGLTTHAAHVEFSRESEFGINSPSAYSILLEEAKDGHHTLFSRWDFVKESWKLTDKILKTAKNKKTKLPNYKAGSWGPKEADDLIKKDKKEWIV